MNKYDIQPRYPTQAAALFLGERLGIGHQGQDWAVEQADAARVEEFLRVYEGEALDEDERFLLMALIVASYDELARIRLDGALWRQIRGHLCEEFALHAFTVEYWALTGMIGGQDDPEAQFPVTPYMREILHHFLGPADNCPTAGYAIRRFCESVGEAPNICFNSIDIGRCRNAEGFHAVWSTIPGRKGGERTFATAEDAQRWAEGEFGVRQDQWNEIG